MEDDVIVNDEEYNLQEQEDNSVSYENQQAITLVNSEEIDIQTPVFTGFGVAGTMCILSLGISVLINMLRRISV